MLGCGLWPDLCVPCLVSCWLDLKKVFLFGVINGVKAYVVVPFWSEYHPMVEKSENKRIIEQLLMQEIFSRNRTLIRILTTAIITFQIPTCLSSAAVTEFTEGEAGSPVDVAKSFMQTLLSWTSSSKSYIGYKSPSPTGAQLFKEETTYSLGYSSSSASKMKKDSSASAKWNILIIHLPDHEAFILDYTFSFMHILFL
ncbi:hypothetical protein Ddye_020705 [Dipteronia dyeriana]|uniref:Uncharacterized protein n=1 Tax=Dipteronia dyeriana TaxID=168575 RepID=A0AAD9WXA1_9ROSI|nr:hypothetical protein Ddye_020705 [Dipteronia dyeriana]